MIVRLKAIALIALIAWGCEQEPPNLIGEWRKPEDKSGHLIEARIIFQNGGLFMSEERRRVEGQSVGTSMRGRWKMIDNETIELTITTPPLFAGKKTVGIRVQDDRLSMRFESGHMRYQRVR